MSHSPPPCLVPLTVASHSEVGELDHQVKTQSAAVAQDAQTQTLTRLLSLFYNQPETLPNAVAAATHQRR